MTCELVSSFHYQRRRCKASSAIAFPKINPYVMILTGWLELEDLLIRHDISHSSLLLGVVKATTQEQKNSKRYIDI
jgi:hypothetical protein